MAVVPYKAFWAVLGASISTTLAVLVAVLPDAIAVSLFDAGTVGCRSFGLCDFGIPLQPIAMLVVVVIGLALAYAADFTVHTACTFDKLSKVQLQRVARLCKVAIFAYTLWTVSAIGEPSWWPLWIVLMSIIGLAVYGGCHATEYALSRPTAEWKKPEHVTPTDNPIATKIAAVLSRIGHRQVKVVNYQPILDDGRVIGHQFIVQTPPKG